MKKDIREVPSHTWLKVDSEGNCYSSRTGSQLKPYTDRDGYLKVGSNYKGQNKRVFVHRAVALTFIPNPENKPCVNHKDSVRDNNHVDNLEWCTHKENTQHGLKHGFIKGAPVGEANGFSVYEEKTIIKICQLLQDGLRNKEIYSKIGIPSSTGIVKDIRTGKTWNHISKNYSFPEVRRSTLSEGTIRWVCEKLQEGLTVRQIKELSTSKSLTESKIRHIKNRNLGVSISVEYQW